MSDELGKATLARRYYKHVLHGGALTPDDVSRMVVTIEELEAERNRWKEAYRAVSRDLNLVVPKLDAAKSDLAAMTARLAAAEGLAGAAMRETAANLMREWRDEADLLPRRLEERIWANKAANAIDALPLPALAAWAAATKEQQT